MMPLSKLYYEHFIPFLHRAISQATALPGVGKYFPIDSNLNHVQARRFFFFTFPSLLSFFVREKSAERRTRIVLKWRKNCWQHHESLGGRLRHLIFERFKVCFHSASG